MPQRPNWQMENDMRDLEKLYQRQQYGDTFSLASRMDYEHIFSSNALTPTDRQTITMYLLNLDEHEMALILGISQQGLSKRVHRCLGHMVEAIAGSHKERDQTVLDKHMVSVHPTWDEWMYRVLHSKGHWWHVPNAVRQYIQQQFGTHGLSQDLTDYNEEKAIGKPSHPIKPTKSVEGVDTTFAKKGLEIAYMDELYYGGEHEEDPDNPEAEFDMRVGKRKYRPVELPHYNKQYVKHDKLFEWAPTLNSDVTFYYEEVVKTSPEELIYEVDSRAASSVHFPPITLDFSIPESPESASI